MFWRWTLKGWRMTFSVAPVTRVQGVNSKIDTGDHILMWDFDEVDHLKVALALEGVQSRYDLPAITVLNSGKPEHFMAYCLRRHSWQRSIEIVAATRHVDMNFLKYSVYRGYFTLRISPKLGRAIRPAFTLPSPIRMDVAIDDLGSFEEYETIRS